MLDSSREWLARVRSFSFIAGFAWLGLSRLLSPRATALSLSLSTSTGKWTASARDGVGLNHRRQYPCGKEFFDR